MPERFETLADLHRAGGRLWTACKQCGHIARPTAVTLTGGAGGGFARPDLVTPAMEVSIESVAARLKCSSCGARDVEWTVELNPYR